MTHPASPRECPNCHDYLLLSEPNWVDGEVKGEVDVCRHCGPLNANIKPDPKATGEDKDVVTEADDKPAARKTTAKK
ncbi:hypothetical protein ABZ215_25100 [Amycolatopsis sp. NPDC006131]|uniref:hypothetical protein n=1 Tax=Amycolatopsis sp. NPDC006131 TaxID=3156731 RepID=UPI0033AFCFAD